MSSSTTTSTTSHDSLPADMGRFHAQWRRENPCEGVSDEGMSNTEFSFGGENIGGA